MSAVEDGMPAFLRRFEAELGPPLSATEIQWLEKAQRDRERFTGWCRSVAKALDAKPWVVIDGGEFSCLSCARYIDFQHAHDCRMRELEDLSRTIPKELLE